MQDWANSLVNSATQCWTCPIFDNLFAIISNTAAAAYQRLILFSVIIFTVLMAFYIFNAVWQNLKDPSKDPFFQTSIKPVLIKALIAMTLLTAGLMVPRIISQVTFEPAAELTYQFSKTMLPADYTNIPEYNAIPLNNDGFFSSDLRDTIVNILRTSVSNFQVFIEIGIGIMDEAFSLRAILGHIGVLIRHIIMFFIGLYLTYNFGKLFIKYAFCFMDIIVAMALFAFFFPLSLVFFIFKDAQNAPGWMKKLGAEMGSGQIKKLINAIVSVAATVLTYSIIMAIIRGFLDGNGADPDSVKSSLTELFNFDLDNSSAAEITVAGAIVLVYIINYIADEVPKVTQKILEAFGVKQEDSLSKEMGENAWKLSGLAATQIKNTASTFINPEKADANNTETKTEEKSKTENNEKKEDKK